MKKILVMLAFAAAIAACNNAGDAAAVQVDSIPTKTTDDSLAAATKAMADSLAAAAKPADDSVTDAAGLAADTLNAVKQ